MFFDRPGTGERALLVHCVVGDAARGASTEQLEEQPAVVEFVDLAKSSGVSPIYLASSKRREPTAKFYVGSGKVTELAELVSEHEIEVVLFNQALSPSQERNLEKELQCRVLDRTGLILDIFAQRARSHVGKLQVELAQLEHISTRLVRGWTHLERQKGGIGMRGPGESQLETDRRLLGERVKWLNRRLDRVNAQRLQSKRRRLRTELPTLALVGYTNAGKSTLFNALTDASVYAEDQLFATLDTTLRSLELPGFGSVVLADTVGFVRDLPHKLVEAFKATLEEASEADLILHVVDASAPDYDEQIEACTAVLKEIGAGDIPSLLVMNKIDALETLPAPRVDQLENEQLRIWLSAAKREGVDLLTETLAQQLATSIWQGRVRIPVAVARLRAELYDLGAVVDEQIASTGDYLLALRYRSDVLEQRFRANDLDLQSLIDSSAD